MATFENKYIEDKDVHYSRIIASWINAGGEIPNYSWGMTQFADWLTSLGFNVKEVYDIWNMATCGKMEFEDSAKKWITNNGNRWSEKYKGKRR